VLSDEMRESGNAAQASKETLNNLKLPDVYLAFFQGSQMLATNYTKDRLPVFDTDLLSTAAGRSGEEPSFVTLSGVSRQGARVALRSVKIGNSTFVVAAFQSLFETHEQLEFLRRTFYLGIPAALILAGLGGY